MAQDLWAELSRAELYLDQTDKPLELDRAEIEEFYAPLARLVLALPRSGERAIVAVAGPPGVGKSAFSATLAAVLNVLAGREAAATVGMDAWHLPNAYLDSHYTERDGQPVLMRSVKGSPETYDHAGIQAFLEAAHAQPSVAYPAYSRELHDPVPDAGRLTAGQHIVILEGNYFLLDEPPWRDFQRYFDLTIFLTGQVPDLFAGLHARHVRGGKDPDFAARYMARVDIPNSYYVLEHSLPADVMVYKADNRRISRVEYLRGEP